MDKFSSKIFKDENVPNCPAGNFLSGKVCKDLSEPNKVRFIYLFSAQPDAGDKFLVLIALKDSHKGDVEELLNVSLNFDAVVPDLETFDRADTYYTKYGFDKVNKSFRRVVLKGRC